jgi:flagellar assembly factor FliW
MTMVAEALPFEAETVFGRRTVEPGHVMHFPQGLRGLERYTSWMVLVTATPGTAWLQSLDEPALALLLVDPFEVFMGYEIDIPPTALAAVEATPADPLAVFAAVTLGGEGEAATANLRGPIVINWSARRGVQCVLEGVEWSVRQPIPAAVLA